MEDNFARTEVDEFHLDEKGHGDENFSTLRRTALSLLKQETTAKMGVKNRRLKAGWDEAYMEKVVFGT